MSDISQRTGMFPDDDIDPNKKDEHYCRKYAEAIYDDWMFVVPRTLFAHNALEYEINKSYALGYQDTAKYKKQKGVDDAADSSYMNIDWAIRNIVGKFRRIALGKLQKNHYNLNFRAVDPTAADEMTKYYADIKAKILLREQLLQQAPQLVNMPAFARKFGDPTDMEELQMQMDYGSKTNIAIDAEEGVQVVFQDEDNNIYEHRKNILTDLFDEDVSGFKTWIDENGRVRFRKVDLRNVVTNYCQKRDFSDLTKAGEVIQVDMSEIAKHFGSEDMEIIKNAANSNQQFSKYNTYTGMFRTNDNDKSKIYVFDCQWKSYNTKVKEQSVDPSGNIAISNTKYKNRKSTDKVTINGKQENKYIAKTVDMNYGCKWIIGTEFCYDWGPCKDQPRSNDKKKAARTKLDFEFYASDMHEMRTNSIMKQLRPMADEYQLLVYTVQNLNNRLMPFGWAIDFDAIEDIALGQGGANLKPSEVIDMFFQSQLLVYRRKDVGGNQQNYKPIEAIQTSFAQEMVSVYQHMASIIAQIRDISGLNELVDGSTANQDRMPTGLIEANQESANNALFSIIDAEKCLLEKLAMSCFRKLQIALKAGDYGGYVKAIGTNTVKAITVAPTLVDREMALTAEERPTDEKKQYLMQLMQKDVDMGLLDASDALIIMDMYSTAKAYQILTYKVKKNKAAAQQNANQNAQVNGQEQQKSLQMASQLKEREMALAHQYKMEQIREQGKVALAVQEEKGNAAEEGQIVGAKAQIIVDAMSHHNEQQAESPTMGEPQQPAMAE